MRSPRINGGELRGQPANPVSPEKWPLNLSVCVATQLRRVGNCVLIIFYCNGEKKLLKVDQQKPKILQK